MNMNNLNVITAAKIAPYTRSLSSTSSMIEFIGKQSPCLLAGIEIHHRCHRRRHHS